MTAISSGLLEKETHNNTRLLPKVPPVAAFFWEALDREALSKFGSIIHFIILSLARQSRVPATALLF